MKGFTLILLSIFATSIINAAEIYGGWNRLAPVEEVPDSSKN
jgi:hypothetical protein